MEALLSIIVPIYGIDRYLGICIESILNQTYKNIEVILVDDGSPDRCPDICDLYANKDDRIKVIHKENGGLVSARKAGILAATGEYIGYVDGDDWIGPGFYQSLYCALVESNADVVAAGFSRDLFGKSQNIYNSIPSGVYQGKELFQFYSSMISNGSFFQYGMTTYVWNKLFKRELVIEKQLAVDNRITIGEDAAVVYPALLSAKKICVTDNCAYHYRQREDSMLKTKGNFQDEAFRLKLLYDYLIEVVRRCPEKYHLERQVRDFMLGLYVIRSGGRVKSSNLELRTFPLAADIQDKKVLLYGAGTFGQQVRQRLKTEQFCEVVGWVDDDFWEYRRCCMDVDPVERAVIKDYDKVLILNLNPAYVAKAIKHLMDCGVEPGKILSLVISEDVRDMALSEYLNNSE